MDSGAAGIDQCGGQGDMGMSRDWTYYWVVCKSCGNIGELRIWVDESSRWDHVWKGFKGLVYITGAQIDTVVCLKCSAKDIEISTKPVTISYLEP
jgi:hypothetical protein